MSALSQGPYVCVWVCSKREIENQVKDIELMSWQCWILDMKALDALSPPWLRKGPDAGASEWLGAVREFGSHCRRAGEKAAPSGRVDRRMDMNVSRGVGLMVLVSHFDASVSEQTVAKEAEETAQAVLGEFQKLAKKSRSKSRPVIRPWEEAPEGVYLSWGLDLLGLKSGGKSERWAEEFCAAIEASQVEAAAAAPAPSSVCGPKSL